MTLEEVKEAYSMRDVAEMYGFEVNRAGMMRCPFHQNDKDASLKIYKKDFHCFGCGAHGDQIDFVAKLTGVSFKDAFLSLGGTYEDQDKEEVQRKMQAAEAARQKKREKEFAEQERKRLNNQYITALRNGLNCFPVLSENWCQCRNELEYQLHIHDVINTERR